MQLMHMYSADVFSIAIFAFWRCVAILDSTASGILANAPAAESHADYCEGDIEQKHLSTRERRASHKITTHPEQRITRAHGQQIYQTTG